jgi:hypothetical protein
MATRSGNGTARERGEVGRLRLRIEAHTLPGSVCDAYHDVRVTLDAGGTSVEFGGDAPSATWETEIRAVANDDGIDLRGPAVRGPRGERFVYLVWTGRLDDQPSAMFRRAKLQLGAIPPDVLQAAIGGVLVGRLGLTDGRGMPRCAAVRPPFIEWSGGAT